MQKFGGLVAIFLIVVAIIDLNLEEAPKQAQAQPKAKVAQVASKPKPAKAKPVVRKQAKPKPAKQAKPKRTERPITRDDMIYAMKGYGLSTPLDFDLPLEAWGSEAIRSAIVAEDDAARVLAKVDVAEYEAMPNTFYLFDSMLDVSRATFHAARLAYVTDEAIVNELLDFADETIELSTIAVSAEAQLDFPALHSASRRLASHYVKGIERIAGLGIENANAKWARKYEAETRDPGKNHYGAAFAASMAAAQYQNAVAALRGHYEQLAVQALYLARKRGEI